MKNYHPPVHFSSQVHHETAHLFQVLWFQIVLQFCLAYPHMAPLFVWGNVTATQQGFEEKHLGSDTAFRTDVLWEFVLVNSTGSISQERGFDAVTLKKKERKK